MQIARNTQALSEREYRIIERLSYSSIKSFDNDRQKFYNEYILGEKRADKETTATIAGSLVHCLLSGQDFDDKFMISAANEPTGQMKDLVDALYTRWLRSYVNGEQTDQFEKIFMDAVQAVKYDADMKEVKFKGKSPDKIIEMFSGDPEIYFKEKLSAIGKTVVSVGLIQTAEKLVDKIKYHPYTSRYVNIQPTDDLVIFNELPILFEDQDVPYKSMIDKVIVNHKEKTIQLIDYKTSWNSEEPKGAYLKYGYYLQAAMYNLAIKKWAAENDMGDYKILPMKFIFCDTSGFSDPVVLDLTDEDVEMGYSGFTYRGYVYNGLRDLMSDIQWHIDSRNWNTSRTIYEKNGHLTTDIKYGT